VAKHLAVTAATASDAVTSLVDKGLVQKRDRLRMDERSITLTTQGRQTQTASWSDFLLNTVNELSEEEQVIFCGGQNDSQASTTGTNFSGKMCYLSILSAQSVSRVRSSIIVRVNAPFAIAIFVSTVPNTYSRS